VVPPRSSRAKWYSLHGAKPDTSPGPGPPPPHARCEGARQHKAQGADKAVTNAIDTHVQAEQAKRADGPADVIASAAAHRVIGASEVQGGRAGPYFVMITDPSSADQEHALAEQGEGRSAEGLALEHLEPVDVAP
jgi:hypothetical protein